MFSLVQEVTYKVPDRETGLQTLAELKGLCPNRKWNFVEVWLYIVCSLKF